MEFISGLLLILSSIVIGFVIFFTSKKINML